MPKRETMNAPAVAVVATERSTPPVSITSVCPAAISPSTAAYRNVVETCFGVRNAPPPCARLTMSVADEERDEDERQHDAGLSPARRRQRRPRARALRAPRLIDALALLPDREAADHHDEHDQRALDHLRVVLVDALMIRIVFDEREHERRGDRADQAADAAEQRDAAEHDRGDASSACRCRPRCGSPSPEAAVSASPPSAANAPEQRVGADPRRARR